MKLSELISLAQETLMDKGDLEVYVEDWSESYQEPIKMVGLRIEHLQETSEAVVTIIAGYIEDDV